MSSELSLLAELYNPLYLFPIIGVVFTAFMVFAFGFKSSTQPPNEVFDALNDRHHKNYKTQETVKKKKQNKISSAKSEPKSEPNGHINSGSVGTDEKTQKKSVIKPKPSTSVSNNTIKLTKKVRNKKNEESIPREDIDDKDSGEWVELISRKERKNRKQKEEQILVESKEQPNRKTNKKDQTLDKTLKKSKEVKSKKIVDLDTNANIESKQTENVVKVENEKNINSIKSETVVNTELLAEEPDIYELAKEQRVPKKVQKQRNQKRGSDSEAMLKVDALTEKEPKANLDLKDKLTAYIVANYESSDHNKSDSTNTSNNKKKKEKNKKKQSQTQPSLQTQTEDKIESNVKKINKTENNCIPVNDTEVEKSENSVNALDIPIEIKTSEEEEFKSVTKKRRARRE